MLRLLIPLLLPLSAWASDATNPGIPAATYLQATLALVLIIGLLFGTAWLARKLSGGKGFGRGGMKIVGGVALGPRERIVLVEVGETWLVIGIVPGQIRTLHQLPKGVPLEAESAPGHPEAPFAQWLKSIKERQNNA
ncbi:MAG: flagellar biosynthetic protein FliO [Gammaproteobacteria bacterium]|nr:flagellar biosynthetic protein FliO [Gammaproteobacteria bacterium]MBU1602861.1 flagellar biosynthetic protein FliO [Gammaproteobacteria bacterium]MBU2432533.1 flagellar biosynthetic protein FliO [Gammaproteobacteria bacterium]MBU2448924.1 flagellar biosynthetic protein FliO [Gammaproteobacteria bacterium]